MSSILRLVCVKCAAAYPEQRGGGATCPRCGPADGILDVQFDLERARRSLARECLGRRAASVWRYRELLPLSEGFDPAGSGLGDIGWTPLLEAPRLAAALGIARLRLKDESRNPSASFKDRASAIGVARAIQEGAGAVACASTGNAASSLAHCAAAAGLACNIFVPQRIPEGKLAQLLAYGARVFRVRGSYADAYELCARACERFGWYNRNCAVNPYLVEGKKTGGLELAEQCADDPPDWVAVSVGDGCTIAGIGKGLAEMRAVGVVSWSCRLLGVQAANVAPIARAFEIGRLESGAGEAPGGGAGTYADSINCPVPRNWRKAVRAVRDSGGAFVTVTDEQIMEAVRGTGRLAGVFAEPAAAAAVAGVVEARRRGILDGRSSVVAVITGSGLKDIRGAVAAVGGAHEIDAALEAVAAVVGSEGNQAGV